ncbi:C4-dicarboxylate transporter permease large protein [Gracilibacillus halophilus YIM-C55.5]|uniref:C4-dicarboxylate transporter permease large protein n=1 Tax=Gracilibacillus halophilus YIM-C55.5 TaxID=1308866 RepID=N4WA55_9BACI|nr:TRAP transporter large permease [Gracilibacillus halophilus]ENH96139.1 C4-dicarboxylate transporter permease large protein [Gracilibacillus halophilus YIM-C55.5]
MISLILFGSLLLLLILAVPVGIALGIASFITILFIPPIPVESLFRDIVTSLDNFPLLAVPLFILAGELMSGGGISERLMNFGKVIVGKITGGLAIVAVLTSMFFAAISGSGPATVAAVGGMLIPAMIKEGYDKKFATSVIVSAGSLGIIIPPSIPLIMYGVSSQTSVGNLFLGGILPGILIGLVMVMWCYIYSKMQGYISETEPFTFKLFFKELNNAKWALLTPVIILGGIYSGQFTPTEAAVVSVVYAFVISVFVYKEISLKNIPQIITKSSLTSAAVVIIISAATAFGQILTLERIPNKIATGLTSISENTVVILLLITLMLLIVGMFMDTAAAVIILTPILFPVAMQIGLDPVHFGVMMIANLSIGFITPPLGVNLFVGSGISGVPIPTLAKNVTPFLIGMLLTLLVIILVPFLSLVLV